MSVASALTCSNCGDTIDEYRDTEKHLGRCCVGLARAYRPDGTGLYTVPCGDAPVGQLYGDDEEDDYENEDTTDERPTCRLCGDMDFRVVQTRSTTYVIDADGHNDDYEDDRLWYDTDNMVFDNETTIESTVRCRGCASIWHGELQPT